jgi:hypothetical protein
MGLGFLGIGWCLSIGIRYTGRFDWEIPGRAVAYDIRRALDARHAANFLFSSSSSQGMRWLSRRTEIKQIHDSHTFGAPFDGRSED